MIQTLPEDLANRVIEASKRLAVAHDELAAAIAELSVPEEADTTFVSDRVRRAFAQVAAAKVALGALVGEST